MLLEYIGGRINISARYILNRRTNDCNTAIKIYFNLNFYKVVIK